jgi:cell division protein ZapE
MTGQGVIARYEHLLADQDIQSDLAQQTALRALDRLQKDLIERAAQRRRWWSRLSTSLGSGPPLGVYLWGGVGRGKTFLMDLFFETLPVDRKLRLHFHRFMFEVHKQLKPLQNVADPLTIVADRFAKRTQVLCFDELFVADITDAMILGTLFRELFARNVALVATSNQPPDELYSGGLQRERFLGAIDQLETHMQVIAVDGPKDYRLAVLERANLYQCPLGQDADGHLADYFRSIAGEHRRAGAKVKILGRSVPTRRLGEDVVWFDFPQICDGPRSQNDYVELARCFHTVLISNVPTLDSSMENQARRFIALIDELYDRRVKLALSAAAPAADLYRGNRLRFEFQRTISRLQEMQTHDYLASPHLP